MADEEERAAPKEMGRPTKYSEEFVEQARKLCEMGATDEDLGRFFDVNTSTIWRWKLQHQDFCNAIKIAKETADDRVEMSLYRRALGYTFESEKLFHNSGEVVRAKTQEHVPPDPASMFFWLKNRRKDKWRDVRREEVSGPDGGPVEVVQQDADAFARRISSAAARAAENSGTREPE